MDGMVVSINNTKEVERGVKQVVGGYNACRHSAL